MVDAWMGHMSCEPIAIIRLPLRCGQGLNDYYPISDSGGAPTTSLQNVPTFNHCDIIIPPIKGEAHLNSGHSSMVSLSGNIVRGLDIVSSGKGASPRCSDHFNL